MARDTARAAAQSWPDANPQFIRPPLTRSRPALADTSNRAEIFDNDSKPQIRASAGHLPEQFATAALLDRFADLLLALGQSRAAERLSHRAADLRSEVAS